MKRINLLGDSIRLGYQDTVKAELSGQAEIWSPAENCMHSVHHTFNLCWYIDEPADIIHFNFGLWDVRLLGEDQRDNAVPMDIFTRNLDFILRKTNAATDATLAWATITPVIAEVAGLRFPEAWRPARDAQDCVRYNEAAQPVLEKYGVHTNDLHGFVMAQGKENMICGDGVHYTDEGYAKLGRKVADFLRGLL